ncbi:Acetyltransferase [Bacteroides ovatus]|nr:Acetyltransferase [Bacteroides ovatus]CAG9912200.1 Acetyltransferase [Bacteroides ovatus]
MEFDRSFPQKERMEGTSTQKRFAEVLAMQKDYDSINNK